MCRLNYNDLLYMIVEYDIDEIKQYFRQKARQHNAANGREVEQASNQKILDMHNRRKVVNKDGES